MQAFQNGEATPLFAGETFLFQYQFKLTSTVVGLHILELWLDDEQIAGPHSALATSSRPRHTRGLVCYFVDGWSSVGLVLGVGRSVLQ
eukprot:228361-Rhodomonas_salina.1